MNINPQGGIQFRFDILLYIGRYLGEQFGTHALNNKENDAMLIIKGMRMACASMQCMSMKVSIYKEIEQIHCETG